MNLLFLKIKNKKQIQENPFGYFVIKGKKPREGATIYLVIDKKYTAWVYDDHDGEAIEMYVGGIAVDKNNYLIIDKDSDALKETIEKYIKRQLQYYNLHFIHYKQNSPYDFNNYLYNCKILYDLAEKHSIDIFNIIKEVIK